MDKELAANAIKVVAVVADDAPMDDPLEMEKTNGDAAKPKQQRNRRRGDRRQKKQKADAPANAKKGKGKASAGSNASSPPAPGASASAPSLLPSPPMSTPLTAALGSNANSTW